MGTDLYAKNAPIRNFGLLFATVPIIVLTFGVIGTSLFVEDEPESEIISPQTNLEPKMQWAQMDLKVQNAPSIFRHPSPLYIHSLQP